MEVCEGNIGHCKENPMNCGYSIKCKKKNKSFFVAGNKCPNAIFKAVSIPEEMLDENICNLTTCRYNTDGKCENEEKRKECVVVSRKVLCLEKNFIGVIENTGQEICGTITKHYIKGSNKGFIRTFNTTRNITDFGVTSKLRLVTGEVIEVYKSDNCQRLVEY